VDDDAHRTSQPWCEKPDRHPDGRQGGQHCCHEPGRSAPCDRDPGHRGCERGAEHDDDQRADVREREQKCEDGRGNAGHERRDRGYPSRHSTMLQADRPGVVIPTG
jgi:hypothetical protein